MGDAVAVVRIAVGATLLVAAIGKLIGPAHRAELMLVVPEILVGVGLVMNVMTTVAAVGALALTGGFFLHSLRPNVVPCNCFGARLPVTSQMGQRIRNSLLMVASAVQVTALFFVRPSGATDVLIDYSLAVIMAVSLISLPWLAEKSLTSD